MPTAFCPPYTEIEGKRISRGNNINVAAIPARRVVASAGTQTNPDAIDLVVSGNVAKIKGVTGHQIEAGATGDVFDEGVVPIESDGSAIINPGTKLTVNVTPGSTQGCVLPAAPASGNNSEVVAIAETYAPATANYVVMARLTRFTMQGQ